MLWIFLIVLFGGVLAGIPVGFSLGLGAVVMILVADVPLPVLAEQAIRGVNSFPLLAIPLYILVGQLMGTGGIARRLIELASALVGWVRGGLGQVNIFTSMMFGGISGSAVADASAVGGIMIPEMRKQGYTAEHATSITISSSLIGILLPPSIPLILFGVVTETSIGRLFIAGVVPAVLLLVVLMATTYFTARRHDAGIQQPFDVRRLGRTFRQAWLGLLLPIIILVGIRGGYVTPTEAGVVAVLYALAVSLLVYREMKFRDLWGVLVRTARTTGMVMFMVAMAMVVAWLFTTQLIARDLVAAIAAISTNPLFVLVLLLFLMLVVGTILDVGPLILILAPMTMPIAASVGIDPVYYGVMTTLVAGISMLTPPVGTVLFVGSVVGKAKVERVVRAMLPYYLALFATVGILLAFPQLVFLLL